jgi:hypothetical protein
MTYLPTDFSATYVPPRPVSARYPKGERLPARIMVYPTVCRMGNGLVDGPVYFRSYSRPSRARAAITSGAALRHAARSFNATLESARTTPDEYGQADPYGDARAARARTRNLAARVVAARPSA